MDIINLLPFVWVRVNRDEINARDPVIGDEIGSKLAWRVQSLALW